MYNNVVMLILLWHDGLCSRNSTDKALGAAAKATMSKLLALSPCVFKGCDCHVYRAMKDHLQRMNNPPPEVHLYKEQFLHLTRHAVKVAKNETQMCKAIALLSVFVAISSQNVTVKSFDVRSKTSEHHDCRVAKEHVKKVNMMIKEEIGM